MTEPKHNWRDLMQNTIDRLETGAKFGATVRFDAEAAEALAKVLRLMTETLDITIHGLEEMSEQDAAIKGTLQ